MRKTEVKAPLPSWAQPGKVRFTRWDGGAQETAKAFLSGWAYINEPNATMATTNWYKDSRTIELLLSGGINTAWLTFSCGFSEVGEEPDRQDLREYVKNCHKYGIRAIAYMSMTNNFVDDVAKHHPKMDSWLQRDINGGLVLYKGAKYEGKVTRYLSCIYNEDWRALIVKRVKQAAEAGFDGIMYDNLNNSCRCEKCNKKWLEFQKKYTDKKWPWPEEESVKSFDEDELRRFTWAFDLYKMDSIADIFRLTYETTKKINPEMVLCGNVKSYHNAYNLHPNNAATTEEGREPGVAKGMTVHNSGLYRCASGIGLGKYPAFVENALRSDLDGRAVENKDGLNDRFRPLDPENYALSLAEAKAHCASLEIFTEGYFLTDLYFEDEYAMEIWKSIGAYNKFFESHPEIYGASKPECDIVSYHNVCFKRSPSLDFSTRVPLINELSGRGVMVDVRYENDLCEEIFDGYKVLLLADVRVISDKAAKIIKKFAENGGKVVITGESGRYDETFRERKSNPLKEIESAVWLSDPETGNDGSVAWKEYKKKHSSEFFDKANLDKLANTLTDLAPLYFKVIKKPSSTLFTTGKTDNGKKVVHFLNYNQLGEADIELEFDSDYHVSVLSPDSEKPKTKYKGKKVKISGLVRYAVLVIE